MREAPEMIWASCDPWSNGWTTLETAPSRMKEVAYRRADLAWLPEELVERLRDESSFFARFPSQYKTLHERLLFDILAALEKKHG